MYSDVERKWSAEEPLEGFEAELETEPEESEAEDLSDTCQMMSNTFSLNRVHAI